MSVITKEQDIMIDMLLQGETISDIARKIGCTRQSIYTWKDKEYIKAELEARRQQLKKSAQCRIIKDVCTYVDNIKDLANHSSDQRVRLQANKYLIDHCLGTPSVAKEETQNSTVPGENNNNDLKADLDNIKKMRVVK